MKSCCNTNSKNEKVCIRLKDKQKFNLPRKFSKKKCLSEKIKGFSKKSSCAPYKYCKKTNKKTFLFNPNNPKKSFDVYIDKNPKDTINIKYTTVKDVINTIQKLEKLYKTNKYTHKRIWQVAMIMKVRLEVFKKYKKKYPNAKNVIERYNLSNRYFKFLSKRTKTKENLRRKLIFTI
jgi:hypothetical protein